MDNAHRIACWETLRRGKGEALPPMQTETLQVSAETFTDADALLRAIMVTTPQQGWLTYQSESHAFLHNDWQCTEAVAGLPLCGEWRGKDGSYRLGPATHGWVLTSLLSGEGPSYLCDDLALLATSPALGQLQYRRLWRDDADGAPSPWTIRFLGFTGQEH